MKKNKMKNNNLEIRNIGTPLKRSVEEESRHVEGYALVFDSRSEDLGWYETIERSAISQELVDSCDVFALLNHDESKVLARANQGTGSLKLTVDDTGLRYEFDAAHTALGDELLEYLNRGEINTSSFAFAIDPQDKEAETWERKDGVNYRTIHKIAYIGDVSPVFCAAYSETSVSKRSLDKAKELEEREKEENEQKILADLDAKLKEIEEISKI